MNSPRKALGVLCLQTLRCHHELGGQQRAETPGGKTMDTRPNKKHTLCLIVLIPAVIKRKKKQEQSKTRS